MDYVEFFGTSVEKERVPGTVLVTGFEGLIGGVISGPLGQMCDTLIRLDKHFEQTSENEFAVDITDKNALDRMFKAAGHIDQIVHLAGNPKPETPIEEIIHTNIQGTANLYEAARKHGVKRIILASSTHAVGGYEGYPTRTQDNKPIKVTDEPKPDGPYGWGKVVTEVLARYYFDTFGLQTISLRFGHVNHENAPMPTYEKHWLSHRDAVQVVELALRTRVPFGVYFATSEVNNNPLFDINPAKRDLGYRPQDKISIA